VPIPRNLVTFAEIADRLDMLPVDCRKCGRSGRYRVATLIGRYGPCASVRALLDDLMAVCPRKRDLGPQIMDLCGAHCPTLLEALYPASPRSPPGNPCHPPSDHAW
jgi:hypothetical protein